MPIHMLVDNKFINNKSPNKHSKRRNKKSSSCNTAPNSVQKTKKPSRGLDSSPAVKISNKPVGLDLGSEFKKSAIKTPLPPIEMNQNININQNQQPPVSVNLFGGDTSEWDTDAAHLQVFNLKKIQVIFNLYLIFLYNSLIGIQIQKVFK
jgi:hypothetical protein